MTPAARFQAVIEIIEGIETALRNNGAAADVLLRKAFAARRYAGSKDRAAISDAVYGILRSRGLLVWMLTELAAEVTARHLLIAHLARDPEFDLSAIFNGLGHGPAPLDETEAALVPRLRALGAAPEAIALECPPWLEADLRARFGAHFGDAMQALQGRADLTLRVNGLRADPDKALKALKAENISAEPGRYVADALRVQGTPRLDGLSLIRDGWVEVQDEASQIGARLVDAGPRMQVADLCAGAGGKTLALAAHMKNSGQIHAFDTDGRRLGNLRDRMRRANARNIQVRQIPEQGAARAAALDPLEGAMDRVLLDVPCSGTGTWRRSPELRWRFSPGQLAGLTAIQDRLLDEGAALVKPGGRLVYMTCSLLAAENEDRAQAFLGRHGDFRLVPYGEVWADAPATISGFPDMLVLSPWSHGTDGFFVSVFARLAKCPESDIN